MRSLIVVMLALGIALLAVAAPNASAGPEIPPERLPRCEDALGEPKCDAIREEIEDLLTCTCPPW